jgi:hypothetical protein
MPLDDAMGDSALLDNSRVAITALTPAGLTHSYCGSRVRDPWALDEMGP